MPVNRLINTLRRRCDLAPKTPSVPRVYSVGFSAVYEKTSIRPSFSVPGFAQIASAGQTISFIIHIALNRQPNSIKQRNNRIFTHALLRLHGIKISMHQDKASNAASRALQVYRPLLLYQLEKPTQAFYGLGRYLSGLQQNALSV